MKKQEMDLNKLTITKGQYEMLPLEEKERYVECSLCDNHFIMGEGGIFEKENNIEVCNKCLIISTRANKLN